MQRQRQLHEQHLQQRHLRLEGTSVDVTGAHARALAFRLDVQGADVTRALRASAVRPILLKGPSFADLLYVGGPPRRYTDVDLLVDVRLLATAEAVLEAAGFVRHLALADDPAADAGHAEAWFSEDRQVWIDLHFSLPDAAAPPAVVWDVLARRTRPLDVGGITAEVLDAPASALLMALHAAHHVETPSINSEEDLRRASERLDLEVWREARDLAVATDALLPFSVGLHAVEEGTRVADALGLGTTEEMLRYRTLRGMTREARLVEQLRWADRRSAARLIARTLVPTAASLRQSSGLARRGRRGLYAAYALRPAMLALRLPAALTEARRARKPTAP